MNQLQTIAIDIRQTVFDNETEATLYITKDTLQTDSYIIAIPIIAFSWGVRFGEEVKDQDINLIPNVTRKMISDINRRNKLVEVIREGITKLNK